MVNAGRVAIVPQGEWSADATYKRLDAVTHNNTLYFAKKEVPAGTATSNTEYWSKSIVGGAGSIATTENAGIVKPDGTTITIDEDGTIHGQSEITVDGTTITLDEAKGIISLAKTLQDKIKTIDNKLPKTSVVNNNTTTESGFALDARQANPNIEGTMAANILQLNNDSMTTFRTHGVISDANDAPYGISYIDKQSMGTSNNPFPTFWTTLLTIPLFTTLYQSQIGISATNGNNGKLAIRIKDNGTWGDWHIIS